MTFPTSALCTALTPQGERLSGCLVPIVLTVSTSREMTVPSVTPGCAGGTGATGAVLWGPHRVLNVSVCPTQPARPGHCGNREVAATVASSSNKPTLVPQDTGGRALRR